MFEIDYSVVFRRKGSKSGGATVVHYSNTYVVLEIYDRHSSVVLNEVFSDIQITSGRSIMYDGAGVVCNVMDCSSMQVVTLFLKDSWIALGSRDIEAENRFEVERFLDFYKCDFLKDKGFKVCFYDFLLLFSQLLSGLNESEYSLDSDSSHIKKAALNIMAEKLNESYERLEQSLEKCDENAMMAVGEYFKQHLFPLSRDSKIFQLTHSVKRAPYSNYELQNLVQMKDTFWDGRISGVLLDVFFARFSGLDMFQKRADHLALRLKDVLSAQVGKIDVLLIGSDITAFRIVEGLSNQILSRLNIKLVTLFEEDLDSMLEDLKELIRIKGATLTVRSEVIPLQALLNDAFGKGDLIQEEFDQILIPGSLEPLSSKVVYYLVQHLCGHLKSRGSIGFFNNKKEYSSIRENWLLHFSHNFEQPDWAHLLGGSIKVTQEEHDFGVYTCMQKL